MRWLADWAASQVYAFASVDYSGAAISQVYDSDGTTTVGAFDHCHRHQRDWPPDRRVRGSRRRHPWLRHQRGSFSDVDFRGAIRTLAIGVNDVGQIVAASPTPPVSPTDSL